jgi:hypothetical protein
MSVEEILQTIPANVDRETIVRWLLRNAPVVLEVMIDHFAAKPPVAQTLDGEGFSAGVLRKRRTQ